MKENGKVKFRSRIRKINPVDVEIAVIFLLSIVAMGYLFTGVVFSAIENGEDSFVTPIEYRVVIPNVNIDRFGLMPDELSGTVECDFLKIGDILYNFDGSTQLGKVMAIHYEVTTAATGHTDSEGNLIYAEYPRCVDLILTVRGEENRNTMTVGSEAIRVGKDLIFHTPSYFAQAKVVAVNREVQ